MAANKITNIYNSMSYNYFLIISNMRCGSTLLEFMLGELSDAAVDYEVKWAPGYAAQDVHLVINGNTSSLKELLSNKIPLNRIKGSKLTFDPVFLSNQEFKYIGSIIEPEIRIIHIKRRYYDIWLSTKRGFLHIPTQNKDASNSKTYSILQQRADADMLAKRSVVDIKGLRFKNELQQFWILLHNDLATLGFRKRHPYYLVSYGKINTKFCSICAFIGSNDNETKINMIKANPPLRKLSPIILLGNSLPYRIAGLVFDTIFWLAYAVSVLYPRSHQLRQPPAME